LWHVAIQTSGVTLQSMAPLLLLLLLLLLLSLSSLLTRCSWTFLQKSSFAQPLQNFPKFKDPEGLLCIHKSLPLDHILRKSMPPTPSYLSKIHFNINFHLSQIFLLILVILLCRGRSVGIVRSRIKATELLLLSVIIISIIKILDIAR
jgi:hypothetical protein